MAKHIGSEIGLPRLDVLPSARQHRPSASGLPTLVLPQSQGISSLYLTSLSFSLLHIWVIGYLG